MFNIRKRLTFANLVASIALFVALGGVSVAATVAARNSVVSSSIKNGQVKTADIAQNAITTGRIRAGAVGATDVNAALRTDLDDAATVGGLTAAQIVAAAGGQYLEARQAPGGVNIETLTEQDLVTLNLPAAGKYLISARMPFTCTYDGSDGASPANPAPLQPFMVGKAKLLVGGEVVETITQTCEAEAVNIAVVAGVFFGTATAEFTRMIEVAGPTEVKLQGLAETSIVLIVAAPSAGRITSAASNGVIQAVTVRT
jgi:hypothetical protein